MRFLVVGAGALGGYLGGLLADDGNEVVFHARGERRQALERQGLVVELPERRIVLPRVEVWTSAERAGLFDYVLLCVRAPDVATAAAGVRAHLAHDSAVLPLASGLEAAPRVAALLGEEHLLLAFADLAVRILGPARIRQAGSRGRLVLAEPGGQRTWRLECLLAGLESAGLTATPAADWRRESWEHLAVEAALGAVTAWHRCSIAEALGQAPAREAARALLREAAAVAEAEGVSIADPEALLDRARGLGPGAETAMRLDREAGRPLEVEALIGALVRRGRAAGPVATPTAAGWRERLRPLATPRPGPAAGDALPIAGPSP